MVYQKLVIYVLVFLRGKFAPLLFLVYVNDIRSHVKVVHTFGSVHAKMH